MFSRGVSQLSPSSHVAIYGLGERGRTLLELVRKYRADVQVVCFIDSFKADSTVEPPVIKVGDIDHCGISFDTLIVASSFYSDILVTLLGMGRIPEFFFHDNGLTTYPEGAYPNEVSYEQERIRAFIDRFSGDKDDSALHGSFLVGNLAEHQTEEEDRA